ncbi:hypothetical protein D3C80_2137860 [compost metagenome]
MEITTPTHRMALSQLKNWKRALFNPEMPAMVGNRVRIKARKRPTSSAISPCWVNI